jgi:hypothetical protein
MSNNITSVLLEPLTREVSNDAGPFDNSSETMVVIDPKGQTYSKKPGGFNLFTSYRYFVVNTSKTISYNGYLCTLRSSTGPLNVLLDIKIKCQQRDAALLATRIAAGMPGIVETIQAEVENYDKQNTLSEHFFTKKTALENNIIDKLKLDGLTVLSINLQPEGSQELLAPVNISVNMFKVAVLGMIPKASLGISADIVTIPGQEAKVFKKKIDKANVEDELITITREYIEKNIDPQDLFKNYNASIRQYIETSMNRFLADYGKKINSLSITLHKPGNLDAIVLQSNGFLNVRITNSHQLMKLKYTCELVADPDHQARVFLFSANTAELDEAVRDQVKNTLSTEVDAEQFAYELNTTVSSKLAKAISARIQSWGRVVGILQLETDPTKFGPRDYEIKNSVECVTQDGYTVVVNYTVLLQRMAAARKVFEASQVNFDKWSENELKRLTKNFIIKKTYNELFYAFDDSELRDQMQQEAEKLGYSVNQLVTIPDFEGVDKGKIFKITYKDHNLHSKVDGVPLAISLSVKGNITHFSKVMNLLAPKEKVADHMDKTIDAVIRQLFHSVDPGRFYARFYNADKTQGDQKSLEKEVIEVVSRELNKLYGAEIQEITVSQLDTSLFLRYKQLQEGELEVLFEDKSGFFSYKSKISIDYVHPLGWYVFKSRGYKMRSEDPEDRERKAIVTHIKDYLQNFLNNDLIPRARRKEIADNHDFVRALIDIYPTVILEIQNYFGLVISIYNPTKIEHDTGTDKLKLVLHNEKIKSVIEADLAILKIKADERPKRLKELYEKKKTNEADGAFANSPEMKRINDEILELEKGSADFQQSLGNPFNFLLEAPGKQKDDNSEIEDPQDKG